MLVLSGKGVEAGLRAAWTPGFHPQCGVGAGSLASWVPSLAGTMGMGVCADFSCPQGLAPSSSIWMSITGWTMRT